MTYLIWKCPNCKDTVISNSLRHHSMDFCKCGRSGVDYEEYGTRVSSNGISAVLSSFKKKNMNFFEEIVICLLEQGFTEAFVELEGRDYIEFEWVDKIKKLEDEICAGWKDGAN